MYMMHLLWLSKHDRIEHIIGMVSLSMSSIMALMVYARATGLTGTVLVTSGPGATNT